MHPLGVTPRTHCSLQWRVKFNPCLKHIFWALCRYWSWSSTVTDTNALAACSAVSQHFQQYTTRTVQLQLVHVLQHCEELQPHSDLRPLQWLCSVAGAAAVNTTEAGCALLNLTRDARGNLSALFQITGNTSLSSSWPILTRCHWMTGVAVLAVHQAPPK